jgi:hypothetical protein
MRHIAQCARREMREEKSYIFLFFFLLISPVVHSLCVGNQILEISSNIKNELSTCPLLINYFEKRQKNDVLEDAYE